MTRGEKIRKAGLGELAQIIEEAGNNPWCGDLQGCLEDMEQGREVPEERCRACVIGWLLSEVTV